MPPIERANEGRQISPYMEMMGEMLGAPIPTEQIISPHMATQEAADRFNRMGEIAESPREIELVQRELTRAYESGINFAGASPNRLYIDEAMGNTARVGGNTQGRIAVSSNCDTASRTCTEGWVRQKYKEFLMEKYGRDDVPTDFMLWMDKNGL